MCSSWTRLGERRRRRRPTPPEPRTQHEGDGAAGPFVAFSATRRAPQGPVRRRRRAQRRGRGARWRARSPRAGGAQRRPLAHGGAARSLRPPSHQVRGSRRRRGTRPVGHPIGDGRIGPMADRGPHRDGRASDGTGDDLGVPAVELGTAATAPGEDDDVGLRPTQATKCCRDGVGAFGPAIGAGWRSSCHSRPDASRSVEMSASPAVPGAVMSPTRSGRAGTTRAACRVRSPSRSRADQRLHRALAAVSVSPRL